MSDAPFGRAAIYAYLRTLIGSKNAWRTSDKIAEELGSKTPGDTLKVQQALLHLRKGSKEEPPRVTARQLAGALKYEYMALIVDEKDKLRTPQRKEGPARVEIATPADGAVALRVEPVPAPVLPEPSPEAREAVEKLVRSPMPPLTLADLVTKQRARMEQIQADAVVAAALGTGPLSDSHGVVAGEVLAENPHTGQPRDPRDVESDPGAILCVAPGAPIAAYDAGAVIDEVGAELAELSGLIERGRAERPEIIDRTIKQRVLEDLAGIVPPVTAKWLRAIARDIERVGA